MQTGKGVVVVAEDVEGEALATLVVNKIRGTFSSVGVKAPGFGERRKAQLQDIAILTGGTVISEEVGLKLENVTVDMLGRARRVVVTKDDTTVVDGSGSESDVQGRIKQIEREIENPTPTGTARSSRSVSPSWQGCGGYQGGRRNRGGAQGRSTASRTPCRPPALLWRIVPGGGVALLRAQEAIDKLRGGTMTTAPVGPSSAGRSRSPSARSRSTPGSRAGSSSSTCRAPTTSRWASTREASSRTCSRPGSRPRQGGAVDRAERGIDRQLAADHGGADRRAEGRQAGHAAGWPRRPRHGLLI